ncbi:MAG: DNA-binding protein WhiA [Ruminococcaceae bacterium]|nr:DNA-binding protein WhiA [Oscillospiraceae bacterium]
MSFASNIKQHLCSIVPDAPCCQAAQLCALICFSGTVNTQKKLKIKTENEGVAEHAKHLLSQIISPDDFSHALPKSESGIHTIMISGQDSLAALSDALMLSQNGDTYLYPFKTICSSPCCKTAFLRGAFLGGGSISDPSKNYHAEFVTKTAKLADMLFELLLSEQISAKITVRKNSFVVYIKDSEAIASLLGLMGAGMSMMEFYNIKIEREVRNNVNRQVNCDNANLDKVTAAAGKQIAAIKKIEAAIGFDSLPSTLGEIAALRVQNPEISLKELGTLLNPPIGKSGVNHRLERICEIAEKL